MTADVASTATTGKTILKKIVKLICCLIPVAMVAFFVLLGNHLGFLPTMTDVFSSLPGVNRVLPVADRVSQHFSQDIVYQRMHDFELDGNTILSVSDDPMIYLDTVPEQTGRLLKIDISGLSEDPTSAQIFFSFEGDHYFNESNSVRFFLENGLNIVLLPYSGYDRLRLDLAEAPYIYMVVNEVTSANYILLPASFWTLLSIIILAFASVLYFLFFRRSLISRLYNEVKEAIEGTGLHSTGCKSEKYRYLFAAFVVATLTTLTWLFVPVRLWAFDETTNMYTVAGHFTGAPSPLLLYSNIIFGYIMSGLYSLIPFIPWYGVMHVFLIFASQTIILKSFLKIAAQKETPFFVPLGIYLLLYAFFLFYLVSVLQFTILPVMIGSAACIVGVSLYQGESKKARVIDCVVIVSFVFFAYIIRRRSGLGVLPFFGTAVLFKLGMLFLSKVNLHSKLRQLRSFVIIGVCIVGLMFFARAFHSYLAESNGVREWNMFNSQLHNFMDRGHVHYDDAPELYASIGWDRDLYLLSRTHFGMDERVTTDNLRVLNDYYAAIQAQIPFHEHLIDAVNTVRTFIIGHDIAGAAIRMLIFICIAQLFFLARRIRTSKMRRHESLINLLFTLTIVGGFFASLFWLGWGGRVNHRAFLVPIVPAACILCWNILNTFGSELKLVAKKCVSITVITCFIFGFYFARVPFQTAYTEARNPNRTIATERRLAMDQFAIENPENFYVFSAQFTNVDMPIFKLYGEQRPVNLFFWGGGHNRSAKRAEQLSVNGLSELYARNMLASNYYFITHEFWRGDDIFFQYMMNRYNAVPIVVEQFSDLFAVSFININQLFLDKRDTLTVLYYADVIADEAECEEAYSYESYTEEDATLIVIYDQQVQLSVNKNYVFTFNLETENSPDSFWIEWYSEDLELRHIRHFMQSFDIEVGYNNYFGAIYSSSRIPKSEIRFRIVAAPTSDILITNFTIMEVCVK